jgi:TonB-dependent starch-binding outer membrane protein SusC
VLKDASAAAIYGARATNGVILITTRRGAATRTNINFNGSWGWQEVAKTLDNA